MKERLRPLRLFNEIDFAFADYICSVEQSDSEELYLASLCVSFSATRQHSALSLEDINGQSLSEFCGSRNSNDEIIDFTDYRNWPEKYAKVIGVDGEEKPIILDASSGILYLNKYYQAEKKIAAFISEMAQPLEISSQVANHLNKLFHSDQQPDWQKVAAFTALRSRFCVISGGPGTGKTTTVAKILTLLLEQNQSLQIDLLAPTGKAADRLGEAITSVTNEMLNSGMISEEMAKNIPVNSSTIHRYLGRKPGEGGFKHNESNRTSSDLILVDESSMVSLPLFHSLLQALKENCRVILLGDKDQLTAVETGNVLGELSAFDNINSFSQEFCSTYTSVTGEDFAFSCDKADILQDLVIKLEYSYRFGTNSPIGCLAKLINEPPADLSASHFKEAFNTERDAEEYASWKDLPELFDRSVLSKIESLSTFFKNYQNELKTENAESILEYLNCLRILTATRVRQYGSENINREISRHFFGRDDNDLYPGRCIMVSTNDHSLELYNGDVGVILENDGIPTAFFPGKDNELRSFSPSVLPDFETAFAMTIHKSQGSEYDNILIVLPDGDHITRQLLYTGITRARKSVEVISELRTLLKAAQNSTQRFSGLRRRF